MQSREPNSTWRASVNAWLARLALPVVVLAQATLRLTRAALKGLKHLGLVFHRAFRRR